jgi:hypothetical protein
MKANIIINSLTILPLLLSISQTSADAINEVLSIFNLDYDDVVIEKGENWVERYYIK